MRREGNDRDDDTVPASQIRKSEDWVGNLLGSCGEVDALDNVTLKVLDRLIDLGFLDVIGAFDDVDRFLDTIRLFKGYEVNNRSQTQRMLIMYKSLTPISSGTEK